jgi:hypothetical protein
LENTAHITQFTIRIATRTWLAVLMLCALGHGLLYVFVVPVWQAPDEPMLYEYAALTAELGRVPRAGDRSEALEQRLAASLARQRFWDYTIGHTPDAPPRTLAEVLALFPMPRQVGGDPPLYFALAALPLRLTAGWLPERQVLLLRLLNALLLPGLVACAYGAAREVFPDEGRMTDDECEIGADASSPVPGPSSFVPLAVAALVALHPMLAVVGASLSNDGLANLLGAALCWALLRLLRAGLTPRRLALAAGLLALGLLSKRTLLPYLLLLAPLGFGWALRRRPLRERHVSPCVLRPAFLLATMAVIGMIWLTQQFDYRLAASWTRFGSWGAAARAWPADRSGAALRLAAGEMDIQPLPSVGDELLRNHTLRYGARIWSDVEARGRLIIYSGGQRHEWPFEVHGALTPVVITTVAPAPSGVWFGIAADSGWFYADDLWASGAGLPHNLLMNGALDLPALRSDSPLWAVASYLRLVEVAWAIRSGHTADALPYGSGWVSLFFASFWGHFGWMDVPFVLGSYWMPLLALGCLAGGLGALRWLLWRQGQIRQRRQLWVVVLLLLLAVGLPVLNAYAMPKGQALQQGRYLFPELAPVALVLALGQSALLPARWQRGWLLLWLGFWLALALTALARLLAYSG